MNTKGSTHFNHEDRKLIEKLLSDRLSCKDIAGILGKDERSISREVRKRRNRIANGRYNLRKYGYIEKDYVVSPCKYINRFPYVCNGCPGKTRSSCNQEFKYFYDANLAEDNYRIILSDSRTGLDILPEDKTRLDTILKHGIDKGQSIHHIMTVHRNDIPYSERSVYRLVDKNQTIVQAIDLRRKVKLKPRKHYVYKEDNKYIREGRKYVDFLRFSAAHPNAYVTELDTVESTSKGSHKCLLTIHSTATHFMMIYVLERKTKDNISAKLNEIRQQLGDKDFESFFFVSLTDRGSEFCNPLCIEMNPVTGEKTGNMFYCNSYSSYQKGAIEENHTLLRYIIPKGMVFDDLTQETAYTIASHINSFYRHSVDACPIDLAEAYFGKEFVTKTKIRRINPDLVTLNSSLMRL